MVQALDYESNTSYRFTVNVSDNGAVPNTNSTEVWLGLIRESLTRQFDHRS